MNRSLVVSTLVLALMLGGCERPKAKGMEKPPEGPIAITTTTVATGDFPATFEATGQTQASSTVQVYTRVSGYLHRRHFTEGSYVRQGQVLYSLDPADLRNALEGAQASYDVAQAAYTNAQILYNRLRPLVEANAASTQDLDNATAALRNTTAALRGAKANLKQARLNLSYATITAPVSGFIDKSKIDVGTYISAGANGWLSTIYRSDPIYVNFTLNENQRLAQQKALASGKLLLPQNGRFDIELILGDGTTLHRQGQINFIAPFVDTTTGNITYRATLDNRDHLLLPGQFVRVKIKGMQWHNVTYIPQTTLLSSDKGKIVYTLERNNTVSARPVIASQWIDRYVIIDEGLSQGELIAADGLAKLHPGSAITLQATRP